VVDYAGACHRAAPWAFAEKFRALAERTRPRDLYDVVNLYRNGEARPEPRRFMEVHAARRDDVL
jgi:predicted nucleotidyltransferase component of viral defense system